MAALDTLRAETDAQATQHLTLVQTMKRELEQRSNSFISKQNSHRMTFSSAIEKLYKTKQTQEGWVQNAQTTLGGAQRSIQGNERDYQNSARGLAETCKHWEGEWKTYCDQCQDLEDERIELVKDIAWTYANAVSTVCVADDESCEKIRVSLESVDVDKEMENFVKYYGTGPIIMEPVLVPPNQSSPPGRPKQKLAAFARLSARMPLVDPSGKVGAPEVEVPGPSAAAASSQPELQQSGAAGINSSGIALNTSGKVAKDSLAEEYANPSQYLQPAPAQASTSVSAGPVDDGANVLFYG
ncbi:hypothetical protein FRC01_013586 [Tulasnella sp. 417]|nr:hypothetical protein FRC01_013586 [Tulasnella sp. 417]